jgi:hypothetical protein
MDIIIKYFSEKNFKLFIKGLLTLKEEVIKLDPENLEPGLVDLIMDENMFEWAEGIAGKNPSDYDWEAATVIAADLQDILKNSKDER